ncbi:MAG: hypothetical protein U9Q30_09290 [Campylobacterota bacterium]|nr:hypothetical protein [Campylobacterota bacterium]
MILDSLNHNIIKLNDIINNPSDYLSTEEDIDIFKKDIERIDFKEYENWIPNNSGILRWERIGLHSEVNGRLTFNNSIFISDSEVFTAKEIIDTDLNIEDDIPTIFNRVDDFFKAYPIKDIFSKEKSKTLYNKFKENGFETRLKPIFYTSIDFYDKVNGSLIKVKSGKGHLVQNGVYKGKASLCYIKKNSFKQIGFNEYINELNTIYSSINEDKLHNSYNRILHNIKYDLKKSDISHSFEIEFEVEAKGKILLKEIKFGFSNKTGEIEIDTILTSEGYKQLVQLLYGQIKKVFHGDNHHHHKDDVILRVYEKGLPPTITLEQFLSHIKGIEKVEKNRKLIQCNEFIPYYIHEAEGIVAYANMYSVNYVNCEDGKNQIKAMDCVFNSIKSTIARYDELKDRLSFKKMPINIFSTIPFWILSTAFISLLVGIISFEDKTILNITITNDMLSNQSYIKYASIAILFFILLIVSLIFKHNIYKYFCKNKLHNDFRPKDSYYSRFYDTKGKTRWLNIIISICTAVGLYYYSFH